MPKVDGVQALKEIKKINPKSNIVMVTADNSTYTINELEKHGATAIIVKPFKIEVIFETIKKIIK